MFWKPGTEAPGSTLDRDSLAPESSSVTYNPRSGLRLTQQKQLLPIFSNKAQILYALETHRTVIVVGETGCGKSTQLPQYLHEAGWTSGGRSVVCTQPRRVAAMSVAARVAEEMGVRLGHEVGYSIRFDDCSDPERTRIKFVTDGILLRETMIDPLLSRYSVIMLDEAHERSLETDILMGLLKKIQRRRPNLRLIVSSATLEAEKFRDFFEDSVPAVLPGSIPRKSRWEPVKEAMPAAVAPTAVILSLVGRQFPVDVFYLEEPVRDYVRAVVDACVRIHTSLAEGDILAFLPGSEDIDHALELIQEALPAGSEELNLRPFYAALPYDDQMKALEPSKVKRNGLAVRKCVIATNIAETSVTIPGVVYVVDSGFVKMPVFNPLSGLESLVTQPVSKAQANQRAGRAGRLRPGKCFRLYPEAAFDSLRADTPPEMVRTNLASATLQLKALGITDIAHFEFMDAPPAESMIRALELLYSLGALDEGCNLTEPFGRQMAEFPAEPRLAAMLLSSFKFDCSEEALTIAACCSVESVFLGSRDMKRRVDAYMHEYAVKEGDHLTLLNLYNLFLDNRKNASWCAQRGLNFRSLCRVSEVRRQLRRYLARVAVENSKLSGQRQDIVSCGEDFDLVRKCVVAGFFSNAARLAPDGTYVTVRDSRRVVLDPMSVLSKFGEAPEWVVYHDVTLTTQEFMREVTAVNPKWLTEVAEHYYEYKKRSVAALPAPAASELAHLKTGPKKKEAAPLEDDVIDALPVKITFKRKATPDVDVFGKKRDKRRGIGL